MKRWGMALIGTWFAFSLVLAASPETEEWVLRANYADACSCDLTCPCIFGGSPTHGFCKGASLVEIEEGNYGQVDLAGVTVLAVYDSGKWIKFLVSENATEEQTKTVAEFLPIAEGFFDSPVRDVRNVPISVVRTENTVKITADGTLVELEQIRNAAGEPIKVVGLPAKGFPGLPYLNHTQYKTIALSHDSENEKFDFSGTNGYTAEIDASSESVRRLGQAGKAISEVIMTPDRSLESKAYCGLPAGEQTSLLNAGVHAPAAEIPAAFGQ